MAITVAPDAFVRTMSQHWTTTLGNQLNPALQTQWQTMAEVFNETITTHGKPDRSWKILNPRTGTGKTQGTVVYASMLAATNREMAPETLYRGKNSGAIPTGMLIVTRLIEEADKLADEINSLSGFPCSVAKHSATTLSPSSVSSADILIVTHAAYIRALENWEEGSKWADITEWDHGHRRLVVIDESIANVVEHRELSLLRLNQVIAFITPTLRQQYPDQVEALDTLSIVLGQISSLGDDRTKESRVVWRSPYEGSIEFPEDFRMGPLRTAMATLPYDRMSLIGGKTEGVRQKIANTVDEVLIAAEAILSRWAFYAKAGQEHQFHTSRLLIPDGLPAPVVLDATANQQVFWELMEGRAELVPMPEGTRSYRNVTIHVSRSGKVGKGAMQDQSAKKIARTLGDIEGRNGRDRKVFMAVHQDVEHHAVSFAPDFASFAVGHWNAIDGRNDWRDCDTAIILGLPYLPNTWAMGAFAAFQGIPSDEAFMQPVWKTYTDVRSAMRVKHISTSVIQAINRIRCRKVIDAAGNCPSADVFIVLPKGAEGDQILTNITTEMPDVVVQPWAFELDGEAVRIRRGSSHDALLTLMRNAQPGEMSITEVQKQLGLSAKQRKDLIATLKDHQHPLTTALAGMGVALVSTGAGRGTKTYLVKRYRDEAVNVERTPTPCPFSVEA